MKMKSILSGSLITMFSALLLLFGSLAQAREPGSERVSSCGVAGKKAKLGTQCFIRSFGRDLVFERYLDISDAPLAEPAPFFGWKDQQGKLIWLESDAKEYDHWQATSLCQQEGRRLPKYEELISLWRSGILSELFQEGHGVFWAEEGFLDTQAGTFQFLNARLSEHPAKVHCVLQYRR